MSKHHMTRQLRHVCLHSSKAWPKRAVAVLFLGKFSLATSAAVLVGFTLLLSSAQAEVPQSLWQSPPDIQLGSASGRLDHPQGVAANKSTGNVYIADTGNNRVDEFGAWGEFVEAWGWGVADGKNELQTCGPGANPPTAECQQGTAGSGAGQFGVGRFEEMRGGVAVDSAGDVYVGDITNHRVEKFDATGKFLLMFGEEVDKGAHHLGNVCTVAYIAEGDVCGAGVAGGGEGQFGTTEYGSYIAVGSTGAVYVGDKGRIQEFESDGAFKSQIVLEGEFATKTVQTLAVDAAGNLYLTLSGGDVLEPYILKLSPTGSLLDTYTFAAGEVPAALASDAAGDLYAVVEKEEYSHREIIEFGPNGDSIIPVGAGFAVSAGNAPTGHPLLTSLATNVVTGGGGTDLYVTATDAYAKSYVGAYGAPPLNWPPPHHPPEIAAQYALSVEPTSATLGAQINPRFWADTSYYVEYGTGRCVESECSLHQPTLAGVELGAGAVGDAIATRNVLLSGLAPGTTYHYRFVAASSGGGPIYGVGSDEAEATFVTPELPTRPSQSCPNETLRTAASAALPDCRAYEMVTPVEKNNSDIVTLINVNSDQVALDESAVSGEKLTYTTSQAFGDAQGAPYSSQYIASRGSGGWASHDITPSQGFSAVEIGHRIDLEFRAFTEDLCDGVVMNAMTPLLASGATEGFYNLYRRTNCQTEGYETLTSAGPSPTTVNSSSYEPTVQGTSSDGSCTVFRATAPLTPDADPGNDSQVYESCNGHLALVSILPSRKANSSGSSAGTFDGGLTPRVGTVMQSVSADGSRVYWTASDQGPGKLYVRINTMQEQSEVSAGKCTEPEKACTITISAEPAHFWSASKDGATAFYTSNGELFWSSFEAGKANSTPVAGEVTGVVGASEDANRIYFLSEEVLTGANTEGKQPHVGSPNLYLFDSTRDVSDRYRFIGTLSAEDAVSRSTGTLSPVNLESYKKDSRVSPDGLDVVFMSNASLTGYDNIDAHNGRADDEIFVYEATADEGAGRLDCVSCNPTGQRPAGHEIPIEGFESGGWAAALLPPYETELYGSRVVSDDGMRVFFDAYEALVPRDTNGVEDVYEWEAPGAGDCTRESAVFSVLDGGCVSLISSGESPTPSEFVDASPSGSNVFFTTASSLVAQDPGLIDIYDARVDGGFPPIPGLPSICEGEACQGAPSSPLDTSPASASFSGPGDTSSTATVTKVSPKRRTPAQMLAQKLAKALKVCGKQPKRNRKRCQATARRRYAAKSKVENDRKPNRGVKR